MRRIRKRDGAPGRTRSPSRRAVSIVTIGAVVAAGAAVAVTRIGGDDEAPAVAASVLEVATATAADLSGTEAVSGVVENASTIDVLHRIDGVTATASSAPNASTQASVAPAAFASISASAAATSTDPASPTTTTTASTSAAVVAPTTITTTQPTTTTSSSSTTTTTTTTTPTAPPTTTTVPTVATTPTTATTSTTPGSTDTTAPEPTVPSLPSSPTTTTTTVGGGPATPTAPNGSGARPSGSGGGGPAISGGTIGATGTNDASAGTVTERITSLPTLGDTIENGDVLYSVDGTPVVALGGELPAWRTMSIDSDDGADIMQLEESLVALGYGGDLTVDTAFDSATAAAVAAWQEGIGVEPSGEVPIGSIVFVPSNVTVTAIDAGVGDDVTSGDLIMSVSASTQSVVVDLTADQISMFGVGQSVVIETGSSDEQPISGAVTARRSVTSDDAIGVQATITPSGPTGVADGVSVDVIVEFDSAVDLTAAALIPAEALLSRLDGTYAVQVRQSDGSSQWITVDVVQFSGASVAITGDGIVAGIDVLVPA